MGLGRYLPPSNGRTRRDFCKGSKTTTVPRPRIWSFGAWRIPEGTAVVDPLWIVIDRLRQWIAYGTLRPLHNRPPDQAKSSRVARTEMNPPTYKSRGS
jgi:hypothetical protein